MTIKQVTVIDFQDQTYPEDLRNEVMRLWIDKELGNDVFFIYWDIYLIEEYPLIANFILENKLNSPILIHYWW